jgi:hypothetical protein
VEYRETSEVLKQESGFTLETSEVTEFRRALLAGVWDDVEALLQVLPIDDISDMTVS